jgi:hypothetical protein
MVIEQTIEIPPNHRLFLDIPPEVPAGKTIITFTTVSAVSTDNSVRSEELKMKLLSLRGSLDKNAFGGLDGVAYQNKIREEWED